jgi:hypothetical protein
MNEVYSASDIIQRIFMNVRHEDMKQADDLKNYWKTIVCSISGNGQNMFDHSRIVDLKNHVLLVETDHPGWTQLFQMHHKYILNQLGHFIPQLEIHSLSFRLVTFRDNPAQTLRDVTREELEKAITKRHPEDMNNSSSKEEKKYAVPEELKEVFRDMERSMLTKKQKT